MKFLLATILLLITSDLDPDKIARLNKQKQKAKLAYESGQFEKSVQEYKYLIDSMGYNDDYARLNLSSSYYQLDDTLNSTITYSQLAQSPNKKISSIANQQLGVIANTRNKRKEALDFFKKALRLDPTNEDARYNYELLKKLEQEKQDQDQQQQDKKDQDQQDKKDQEQQDQEDQEKKEKGDKNEEQKDQEQQKEGDKSEEQQDQEQQKEGDKSEEQQDQEQQKEGDKSEEQQEQEEQNEGNKGEEQQEQKGKELTEEEKKKQKEQDLNSIREKLMEMNLSPEKAEMILEAMKNKEAQYLQQNKKKATKKKDKSKPDW